MMTSNKELVLGYDYDAFLNYGEKLEISACCENSDNVT